MNNLRNSPSTTSDLDLTSDPYEAMPSPRATVEPLLKVVSVSYGVYAASALFVSALAMLFTTVFLVW